MKYLSTDNGNCRVYYGEGRRLFCFQEDSPGYFKFYVCSRDGEPSHETSALMEAIHGLPKDESATAQHFRAWVYNNWTRDKE